MITLNEQSLAATLPMLSKLDLSIHPVFFDDGVRCHQVHKFSTHYSEFEVNGMTCEAISHYLLHCENHAQFKLLFRDGILRIVPQQQVRHHRSEPCSILTFPVQRR
ncbi:hypothetical protein [Vibrio sp.]|uniref:hypothetical protein n=1 Tax=Vibrio sp. TaxID=678 RepID=UPI003D12C3A4